MHHVAHPHLYFIVLEEHVGLEVVQRLVNNVELVLGCCDAMSIGRAMVQM